MQPQMNPVLAVNLEPFLARHLEALLRACGFDIRGTPECSDFLRTLNQFGKFICETYAAEIVNQLGDPKNTKTKDELISWTIAELRALQAVTFHKFERLITTAESLNPGLKSIDCRMAALHAFRLSEVYKSAAAEWKLDRTTEPMSAKHRDKRRRRQWAPYLVDIFSDR